MSYYRLHLIVSARTVQLQLGQCLKVLSREKCAKALKPYSEWVEQSAQMEVRYCNTAVVLVATVMKPVRRFQIGDAVFAALTFVFMLQDCNHEVAADRRLFSTLRQVPALPVGPGLTGLAYDDMMLEHEEGEACLIRRGPLVSKLSYLDSWPVAWLVSLLT